MTDSQLPEKNYFEILNALMSDEMRTLLTDVTKSRTPQNNEDDWDSIELNQKFEEKVNLLFLMKSMENIWVCLDK